MVQRADKVFVPKPWGRLDLRPWADGGERTDAIGEIWFKRPGKSSPTSLLLKLLFTSQPLSIQVHPDDALAHTLGQPNGKTEAWYVLSADAGASCGLGLRHAISVSDLRTAIDDTSIQNLVNWMPVRADDFMFVPAGTIHAIGAGVVLAEIQQQSDTTFRLFDYGRDRELHADLAVAASHREAVTQPAKPQRAQATEGGQHLLSCPYFTLELIELSPHAGAHLHSDRETWLLVLEGGARVQDLDAKSGQALFLDREIVGVTAGAHGLKALAAYDSPHVLPDFFEMAPSSSVYRTASRFAPPAVAGEALTGAWVLKSERNA